MPFPSSLPLSIFWHYDQIAFLMKSFGAVFPGNESNPSPTPKTNFIWNFSLGALISSRQQILHHAFKLPLQGNGNKSFAIPSRFLKTMATNPLPILQGFLKAMASLENLLKGSWKRFSHEIFVPFMATNLSPFLPRFPEAISYEIVVPLLATNPSPCLQHSWKQFLVKLRYHPWQQILCHAFKVPKSDFLSNLGAIPCNKFLHHSFKVPKNNFLWNWSCCNS